MKVHLSARAETDLMEIGDYIARDSPRQAIAFVRKLRNACRAIGRMPTGHPPRPELGREIRSSAVGHYVIFFTVADNEVFVVRILHGARDIGPVDVALS